MPMSLSRPNAVEHYYTKQGHIDVVQLLVNEYVNAHTFCVGHCLIDFHGTDMSRQSSCSRERLVEMSTPKPRTVRLHFIGLRQMGKLKVVELFASEFGTDVDAKDEDGRAP